MPKNRIFKFTDGVVTITALGWAASSFGPELISMFGE